MLRIIFVVVVLSACSNANDSGETINKYSENTEEPHCYYRAKVTKKGRDFNATDHDFNSIQNAVFSAMENYPLDSGILGSLNSGISPNYIYLELREPCDNPTLKTTLFYEEVNYWLAKTDYNINIIEHVEPISKLSLQSFDSLSEQ